MPSRSLGRWALLGLLLAGFAAAIAYREHFDVAAIEAGLQGLGAAAPAVFIVVYALVTVLILPGSVVTFAGGALFGPVWGTLYNLLGATLGAALAFLIARYLASDWVRRKLGGRGQQLMDGVAAEGWRFVAFVRLVPLFPFNLLNYALGLTPVRFVHYLLATFVFMAPGALAYTYLGYAGREALTGGEGLIQKAVLALALLAAVAFLPRIVARLRERPRLSVEALRERLAETPGGEAPLVLDVRAPEERSGELGAIDRSLNIPIDVLPGRLAELDGYKQHPIAIVCRTDRRSARAARLLARHGFSQVQVVHGGMEAWRGAGYPVAVAVPAEARHSPAS